MNAPDIIDKIVEKYQYNIGDYTTKHYNIVRHLIEAKVLVDRWDLLTDNFWLHKKYEKDLINLGKISYSGGYKWLWGAKLHFINNIDKGVIYAGSVGCKKYLPDNDEFYGRAFCKVIFNNDNLYITVI